MNISHYIGFDVHKKHINFCIKAADGAGAGPPLDLVLLNFVLAEVAPPFAVFKGWESVLPTRRKPTVSGSGA